MAKEKHVDFMMIASQITDFFSQNVVEFDGKIVSTCRTIKKKFSCCLVLITIKTIVECNQILIEHYRMSKLFKF